MRSTLRRNTDGSRRSRRRIGASVSACCAIAPSCYGPPTPVLAGGDSAGADPAVALVAFFQQALDAHALQRLQMFANGSPGRVGRHPVIVLGSARGLCDDLIRESEPLEIGRRQLQRLRGLDFPGD